MLKIVCVNLGLEESLIKDSSLIIEPFVLNNKSTLISLDKEVNMQEASTFISQFYEDTSLTRDSLGTWIAPIENALKEGNDLLCFAVHNDLGGVYRCMSLIKELMKNKYSNTISIIDTLQIGSLYNEVIALALNLCNRGYDASYIINETKKLLKERHQIIILNNTIYSANEFSRGKVMWSTSEPLNTWFYGNTELINKENTASIKESNNLIELINSLLQDKSISYIGYQPSYKGTALNLSNNILLSDSILKEESNVLSLLWGKEYYTLIYSER